MLVILPAVGIGLYLAALDQTVTMASFAKMGSELGALSSASWVTTSYLLTLTSFQPLYGTLSDIFGRKPCLVFAHAVFGLGCAGCGLATTFTHLCVARALAGVGAGGINSVVAILVSDMVPLRERGVWQGYINVIIMAGMVTGGPIGGLAADTVGWRWSFIAQSPICLLALLALLRVLPTPSAQDNWWDKVRRVDFLGAGVFITAVAALLTGLDAGSNSGWGETTTVVTLALTPVLFALFLAVETRAANPFAPGAIIFRRTLWPSYVAQFFNVATQMTNFYMTPLYFQAVHAFSATTSGALIVPCAVIGVLCSVVAGIVMKRTGTFYAVSLFTYGLLVCAVSCLGLTFWRKNVAGEVIGLMLSMSGGGSSLSGLLIALLAHSEQDETAIIVASSYLFRALGGSLGLSVSSAVMQQVLRGQLVGRLGDGNEARRIEEKVRSSLEYIGRLEPWVANEVRKSYQWALVAAMAPTLCFAAIGFLLSVLVQAKKLPSKP